MANGMSRHVSLILIGLCLLTAIAGCRRRPDGVLGKEDMAQLMADIHVGESVVEATPSAFPTDSAKRAFRQSIYMRHGLTPEQAEASLRWYGYNMEQYMEIYDRVLEILDRRMRDAELQAGSTDAGSKLNENGISLEGDSVDVWSGVRFRPFASSLQSNLIPFSMMHDQNWEKGDIYYMRSKLIGNSGTVVLNVAVEYDDGSKELFSNKMIGDGWHEVAFALDTLRSARQVYGTLYYPAPEGETAYIDSLSLTRARWTSGKPTPRSEMKKLGSKRHSSMFD